MQGLPTASGRFHLEGLALVSQHGTAGLDREVTAGHLCCVNEALLRVTAMTSAVQKHTLEESMQPSLGAKQ